MIDFSDVEVLSFDCYGTLIDWERGIVEAARPILRAHGRQVDDEAILDAFGASEAEAEAGPYQRYRAVLAAALTSIGTRYGFAPSAEQAAAFAASVGDWPAFPDSPDALRRLKERFRLAVITNCDDDLFAQSNRRLGVEFDWVITAQQARAYKPSHRPFELAFERIGLPRDRIVHVAQSLFHDHVPAKELGLTTVWVNRRQGKTGSGATPPATATPDAEVSDLRSLVDLAV
jgi:2-haloacid dehalogenase